MKLLPLVISSAVLFTGLLVTSTMSYGKPEMTKKEKKPCTACHVSAKSKELNDVGKCYGEKKSLKECVK
jgi:hypothetical protein